MAEALNIDTEKARAAAALIAGWMHGRQLFAGDDLYSLAVAMVVVGVSVGEGGTDAERKAWSSWLHGIADDVEHGRDIQIGHA